MIATQRSRPRAQTIKISLVDEKLSFLIHLLPDLAGKAAQYIAVPTHETTAIDLEQLAQKRFTGIRKIHLILQTEFSQDEYSYKPSHNACE